MSCDGGEWIATFEGGVSISVIVLSTRTYGMAAADDDDEFTTELLDRPHISSDNCGKLSAAERVREFRVGALCLFGPHVVKST